MEIFYADLGPFCVVSLPPTVFTSNRSDPQTSFRSALALHSLIVALSLPLQRTQWETYYHKYSLCHKYNIKINIVLPINCSNCYLKNAILNK